MSKSKNILNLVDKVKYLDIVWDILSQSYKNISGGLLFKSKYDLLYSTSMWKIILKRNKVLAVMVFKAKHGLKLVAMGADKLSYGKESVIALSKNIQEDLKHMWIEVSDNAEEFLMHQCGAYKYMISNNFATSLVEKELVLDNNGYHYYRKIANIQKHKIIVGTPSTLNYLNIA